MEYGEKNVLSFPTYYLPPTYFIMDWPIFQEILQKIWHYTKLVVYIVLGLGITAATLYLAVDMLQRRLGLFQ